MTDNHGTCPHCGEDMNGGSIWQTFYDRGRQDGYYHHNGGVPMNHEEAEALADEVASQYGATRTKGNWGRQIGLYDMDKDRTVAWKCPDCGETWERL